MYTVRIMHQLIKFSLLFTIYTAVLLGQSVSILIPCYWGHFSHLSELLLTLSEQTRLPDEVVIAISECDKVAKNSLEELQNKSYPFQLKLVKYKECRLAGENRNAAFLASTGDIIIYQDADDLPHLQRIETIAYFFELYGIDYLIHRWAPEFPEKEIYEKNVDKEYFQNLNFFDLIDIQDVNYKKIHSLDELRKNTYITFGNVAVSRNVAKCLPWGKERAGEDVHYTWRVLKRFHHSFFVDAPLLLYRRRLSSN